MKYFGSSLSIAFNDINDKANKIEENHKLLSNLCPEVELNTIEQILDFEFENNL